MKGGTSRKLKGLQLLETCLLLIKLRPKPNGAEITGRPDCIKVALLFGILPKISFLCGFIIQ
jgi:hypothetical protein